MSATRLGGLGMSTDLAIWITFIGGFIMGMTLTWGYYNLRYGGPK
jgi:hypothetical protein